MTAQLKIFLPILLMKYVFGLDIISKEKQKEFLEEYDAPMSATGKWTRTVYISFRIERLMLANFTFKTIDRNYTGRFHEGYCALSEGSFEIITKVV